MLTLHPIPAFSDNYIWCIHDGSNAYVVDPGQAEPVEQYLSQNKLLLKGIVLTHHHWDHTSGVDSLLERFSSIPVWGPKQEDIACKTISVDAGDKVNLEFDSGNSVVLDVFFVPGHTSGHVAYYAQQTDMGPVLFCGDTLFSAGCGRLFEGTPEQMFSSLNQFKDLPDRTLVCCTHEYTTANLQFAQAVEPNNAEIAAHIVKVAALRAQDKPSLPSNIATEKSINPFLRAGEEEVFATLTANCGQRPESEEDSFAKLRAWKDSF